MTNSFDLFVIGTGSAGTTVAGRCRAAGWTVGIADNRPFGGTCALRGCDPKKVLVGAASVAGDARRYAERGVMQAVELDWSALQAFKRTFTDPVPKDMDHWLASEGITTFHERVRFIDEHTLRVGDTTVKAQHILIASGATPAPLGIPGAELVATSEDFLNWETLPQRIIFVGGGYISLEFAHVARQAGAEVTILHRGARALERFDGPLVEQLIKYSRGIGIEIRLETQVTSVRRQNGAVVVEAKERDQTRQFLADAVVHGAGRMADLGALNLESASIRYGPRGVAVNEYLQSDKPHILAAGDAADTLGLPLTPVAVMEGHVAAHNLLHPDRRTVDYRGLPTVVYTIPPLASVGLTEAAARTAGRAVTVHRKDTVSWYSSRQRLAPVAGFVVVVDAHTDEILGGQVLGPHAEELINLLSLAIRSGLTTSALRQYPFAYPTGASDLTYML